MRFLSVFLVAACVAAGASASEDARLSVTGEGHVAAVPDMATVSIGVTAQADTARAAMDETSAGVAALLARLAEAGIEARDIQTRGLSLSPVWSHGGEGESRITGFAANNTVSVRVRALDSLGQVLDGALDDGANTFGGIEFGLQDEGPALDEARAAAVADARRKAEILADAAGVALGPIVSIAEDRGMSAPEPMFRMEAAAQAVPVAAGEMLVTARVSIVWEIGD